MYCKNPVCGSAPGKPVPKPRGLREMAMSRTLKVRSTKLPICMSKGGAILHRNSRAQLAKALQRRRPRSLAHHDRSGHWLNSGYGLQPLCQPKPLYIYIYTHTHVSYLPHRISGFWISAGFHRPSLDFHLPEDAERQRQEDAREEKTSPCFANALPMLC